MYATETDGWVGDNGITRANEAGRVLCRESADPLEDRWRHPYGDEVITRGPAVGRALSRKDGRQLPVGPEVAYDGGYWIVRHSRAAGVSTASRTRCG